MRKATLAMVLLALAPGSGFAQVATDSWENLKQLQTGKTIRVVDSDQKKVNGRLLEVSEDKLSLRVNKKAVVIPRSKVRMVSVRRSRMKQVLSTMFLGGLMGMAAIAEANIATRTRNCEEEADIPWRYAPIFAAVGAGVLGLSEALAEDSNESDEVIYFIHVPRKIYTTASTGPDRQPVGARIRVRVRPKAVQSQQLVQPKVIPQLIATIEEEPAPPPSPLAGLVRDVARGIPEGRAEGISGGMISAVPAPSLQGPIRVGGQVQSARLTSQAIPVFPPLARQARIQGSVRLEAIIGKEGSIENLEVVSGHPLLLQAALDAVRRWRYQPTLLNGVPVEVIATIDVNFTMR